MSGRPGPVARHRGADRRGGPGAAVRLSAAVHHLHAVLGLGDVPARCGIELGTVS